MQGRKGTFALAAVLLVVQLVCWRGSVRLRAFVPGGSVDGPHLSKRSVLDALEPLASSSTLFTAPTPSQSVPCQPLPFEKSPQHLCDHIRKNCPPSGHVDYLQFYYCIGLSKERPLPTTVPLLATPIQQEHLYNATKHRSSKDPAAAPIPAHLAALRVVALLCIISWMLFLFSWVGVVASDFFCPNLGTIAARLGLSESTAGVTFLAFGNGSPDVFSTFGAMRTGSGSLAIGELIGAASYIVSVISGSMMLIAPFRVKAYPFVRDVGFFTVAVAMTMIFLFDGKLRLAECVGMIGLYLLYAATVIIGSWWQERNRRKRMLISLSRDEQSPRSIGPYTDNDGMVRDVERSSSQHLSLPRTPPHPQISPIEYDPDVDPFAAWQPRQDATSRTVSSRGSPNHSPLLTGYDVPSSSSNLSTPHYQRFRAMTGARHSLLGAVEFRDVVRTLQQEALADRSVEIFQSRDPERFLPHPHQHQHQHQHQYLSPDSSRQRLGRAASQRGHTRAKSSLTATSPAAKLAEVTSSGPRRELHRSRSTIGPSAGSSGVSASGDGLEWSMARRTQPSAFDARAVAAAVGDPWKEHEASDGCEQMVLPPPAQPLHSSEREAEDTPPKPRLHIQVPSSDDATAANSAPSSVEQGNAEPRVERRPPRGRKRGLGSETTPTSWQSIRRMCSPTIETLFPSLRHLREKSWLGIAVGLITAPAILILNLTLPVVDDEAERAALSGEKVLGVSDFGQASPGRIRLEGAEGDIYATTTRQGIDVDSDIDDDDEHVINLRTGSPVRNPWKHSPDTEGEDEDNRRGHLQVASALRRLPEDSSPLLYDSPNANHSPKTHALPSRPSVTLLDHLPDDGDADSCCSQDSHANNTQSSHLFLVLSQCVLAPPFCVWAISTSAQSSHVKLKTGIALLTGICLAIGSGLLLLRFRRSSEGEMTRSKLGVYLAVGWARVGAGFIVSILYIMTIVDEVVSILQTLGIILGLSDAILGLTVFAMGNSLGDLVANITIARMGHPVMAISACFAGPLLNLLLGIGISGTWLLSGSRSDSIPKQPIVEDTQLQLFLQERGVYYIDFSPTLIVSGVGLLIILVGTLIAVPLNGFYLNKAIGLTLIITYAVIMTANVLVEIYFLE